MYSKLVVNFTGHNTLPYFAYCTFKFVRRVTGYYRPIFSLCSAYSILTVCYITNRQRNIIGLNTIDFKTENNKLIYNNVHEAANFRHQKVNTYVRN